MSEKRVVTTLRWKKGLMRTRASSRPDHFLGEPDRPVKIFLREFEIKSVSDCSPVVHLAGDPVWGKYLVTFWFESHGHGRREGVNKWLGRRLEPLLESGLIKAFWVDPGVIYFNPAKGEHFTRTALKVAVAFFKAFGIDKKYFTRFRVTQETQFRSDGEWIDFEKHLIAENADILEGAGQQDE